MSEILEVIRPLCLHINPVGSRVTCNPPPTDTDADYLCFVKPEDKSFVVKILDLGCDECSVVYDPTDNGGERRSYRFGEINIILTSDVVFFNRFMAASDLAKRFNLLEKQDRIDLFRAIRGEYPQAIPECREDDMFAADGSFK